MDGVNFIIQLRRRYGVCMLPPHGFHGPRGSGRHFIDLFREDPNVNANSVWVPWALLSALAGALVATLTKVGLRQIDPDVAVAVQAAIVVSVSWIALAADGHWRQLVQAGPRTWLCLIAAGIVTSASYVCLFRAVKLGNISRVVPVDRLSLVFAMIFGAIF